MSAAEQPTLMSLTNEMRNIGGASSRSLKEILADLKRVQGVTSAAPSAPASAAPSVDPATKAAVDKVLSAWGTANSRGSGQRAIRDFSNAADTVPVDPSNASDEQRLGYAMDILKGFSEATPFFSDKAYKDWMPSLVPFIETYKPAQETFPIWKSTADFMATRQGGGPDDPYTYEEPRGTNYAEWEGIAEQLGYKGPIYGTVGYDIEGGGITGIDPQFKSFVDQKRVEGYDFVQYQPDSRNYRQKYGFKLPNGQIVGEFYGEGRDADTVSLFRDFVLPVGTAILGLPGFGSSITQSIGSSILPAQAATAIGSALNLAPEVLAGALGRGVINAGIQAALGEDASDVLRAGVLPIAAPAVSNLIGQAVGAIAPPDFDPVLGQAAQPITDAVQKAITAGAVTGISGGDASDVLRAGVSSIAPPIVSNLVGQGLEALMPADIGVVAGPLADAAQSALTRGALAGISGGDVSDVIEQSLLGSAAQAVGAEFGLSPKTSQELLNIARSDGNINPVSLYRTAVGASNEIDASRRDALIAEAYNDPSRRQDVVDPNDSSRADDSVAGTDVGAELDRILDTTDASSGQLTDPQFGGIPISGDFSSSESGLPESGRGRELYESKYVMVRPEVRAALQNAWDAGTPEQRAMLEKEQGWRGDIARERAEYFKNWDESRGRVYSDLRSTLDAADPRAETRAMQWRLKGEDPRFAETLARVGAAGGAAPGAELRSIGAIAQSYTPVPEASIGSVAQDILSGLLQITPTAVGGVANIAQLLTGGRFGGDVADAAERTNELIRETVGSERAEAQRLQFMADLANPNISAIDLLSRNPAAIADLGLPMLGSMILPVGAGVTAGRLASVGEAAQALSKAEMARRVATAQQWAGTGTVAAQNAAETFVDLLDKGVDIGDAYLGAGLTVPVSLVAGLVTGGGAEGALTRALTQKLSTPQGALQFAGQLGAAGGRESGQEMIETAGQIGGASVGSGEAIDPTRALKDLALAGVLGFGLGTGVEVATNIGQTPLFRTQDEAISAIPDLYKVGTDSSSGQTWYESPGFDVLSYGDGTTIAYPKDSGDPVVLYAPTFETFEQPLLTDQSLMPDLQVADDVGIQDQIIPTFGLSLDPTGGQAAIGGLGSATLQDGVVQNTLGTYGPVEIFGPPDPASQLGATQSLTSGQQSGTVGGLQDQTLTSQPSGLGAATGAQPGDYGQGVFDEIDRTLAQQEQERRDAELLQREAEERRARENDAAAREAENQAAIDRERLRLQEAEEQSAREAEEQRAREAEDAAREEENQRAIERERLRLEEEEQRVRDAAAEAAREVEERALVDRDLTLFEDPQDKYVDPVLEVPSGAGASDPADLTLGDLLPDGLGTIGGGGAPGLFTGPIQLEQTLPSTSGSTAGAEAATAGSGASVAPPATGGGSAVSRLPTVSEMFASGMTEAEVIAELRVRAGLPAQGSGAGAATGSGSGAGTGAGSGTGAGAGANTAAEAAAGAGAAGQEAAGAAVKGDDTSTTGAEMGITDQLGVSAGAGSGAGAGTAIGAEAGAVSGAGAGATTDAGAGVTADAAVDTGTVADAGVSAGTGAGTTAEAVAGLTQEEIQAALAGLGLATQEDVSRAIAGIQMPQGINRDDVTKAISDYMAANPGLSATDVATQVSEQLAKLPTYATPTDVTSAVNAALAGVATQADVNAAIAGIQFPQGITSADVTKAISDYMAVNPGLSAQDVAKQVGDALSGLPTYATPSDVQAAVQGALAGYATSADVAGLGQTTQTAITGVEDRLNTRVDELMRQGADYQTATNQALAEVTGSLTSISEQQAATEAARQADEAARREAEAARQEEARRLALQQQQESQRQQMLSLGASLQGKGASTAMDPYKATFLAPFIVGGEAPKGFTSPLAGFLKGATTQGFLPEAPQRARAEASEQPVEFFDGSTMIAQNPLEVYNPEEEFQGLFGFRQGGIVPMMAQGGTRYGHNAHGGLRVLEHSGKRRVDYRQGDAVTGVGDGQSDDIPAMLADGEFVIPADVVSALGNGSTKAGSDKLYDMMHSIRRHHRSAGPKDLPPPAKKSPLDYITKRRSSR